jgi:2-alkyl-3-oxoalkanoate reductase
VKRVLVIGGNEFIGARVVLALANSDWARPITEPVNAGGANHPNIEGLRFDANDSESLSLALRGADAVVNCLSGRPRIIEAASSAIFSAAARCSEPPLIVHISSMSVYGSATDVTSEDAPLQDDLGPYGRAKVEAEKAAMPYARKVILRPGCEYGPGAELWSGRIAKWLWAQRIGDLGADGDGYCNLVHIEDLVAAVMLSLQLPAAVGQAFNVAIADPPTWNEYLVSFARALGAVPVTRVSRRRLNVETKLLAIPLKAFELAAQRFGIATKLPPPIPPSFLRLARQEIRLDSSNIRRLLGWQCRSLDQGIAETAAWFIQEKSTC